MGRGEGGLILQGTKIRTWKVSEGSQENRRIEISNSIFVDYSEQLEHKASPTTTVTVALYCSEESKLTGSILGKFEQCRDPRRVEI